MKSDDSSDAYDDLDRQLIHALQLTGRAAFSRIGQVLGVSDQTVARRYAKLRGSGAIRVMGLTDPAALGETQWVIRVQCTPDGAAAVAEALARRDDISWVSLVSGGTEITCCSRVGGAPSGGNALLLQRLPHTRSVVGVTAHCVLHTFFGGAQSPVMKVDTLAPDQVAAFEAMAEEAAEEEGGHAEDAEPGSRLIPDDLPLLKLLEHDGRAPLAELAAASGRSQSWVRRRLARLRAAGVLYFDVDCKPVFDFHHSTLLWLTVSPSALERVGRELALHPEVAFVGATTGPANLHAVVVGPNVPALYTYLTTRVSTLADVRTVETSPVIQLVKSGSSLPQPPFPWDRARAAARAFSRTVASVVVR